MLYSGYRLSVERGDVYGDGDGKDNRLISTVPEKISKTRRVRNVNVLSITTKIILLMIY